MKKVRDRRDFIKDYILGEFRKRGVTLKEVGEQVNKGTSTVQAVVNGSSASVEIREYIIDVIGVNPWEKFPMQEYKPPQAV